MLCSVGASCDHHTPPCLLHACALQSCCSSSSCCSTNDDMHLQACPAVEACLHSHFGHVQLPVAWGGKADVAGTDAQAHIQVAEGSPGINMADVNLPKASPFGNPCLGFQNAGHQAFGRPLSGSAPFGGSNRMSPSASHLAGFPAPVSSADKVCIRCITPSSACSQDGTHGTKLYARTSFIPLCK